MIYTVQTTIHCTWTLVDIAILTDFTVLTRVPRGTHTNVPARYRLQTGASMLTGVPHTVINFYNGLIYLWSDHSCTCLQMHNIHV